MRVSVVAVLLLAACGPRDPVVPSCNACSVACDGGVPASVDDAGVLDHASCCWKRAFTCAEDTTASLSIPTHIVATSGDRPQMELDASASLSVRLLSDSSIVLHVTLEGDNLVALSDDGTFSLQRSIDCRRNENPRYQCSREYDVGGALVGGRTLTITRYRAHSSTSSAYGWGDSIETNTGIASATLP